MACDEHDKNYRSGPTNISITIGGILSVVGLLASGVATYNAIQNDIASIKRGEIYQERTNEQFREDLKEIKKDIREGKHEQRETIREFGEKVDKLIETVRRR